MLITLQRTRENHLSTVGTLAARYATLEDGFRDPKVHGETRIPPGRYDLKLRTKGGKHAAYLKRFGADFHKGMLWLQDVPDFEFVYIHIGNEPKDTEGCILIGSHVVPPAHDGAPFTITESEKAYRAFYPDLAAAILRGDPCSIEVLDARAPLVA